MSSFTTSFSLEALSPATSSTHHSQTNIIHFISQSFVEWKITTEGTQFWCFANNININPHNFKKTRNMNANHQPISSWLFHSASPTARWIFTTKLMEFYFMTRALLFPFYFFFFSSLFLPSKCGNTEHNKIGYLWMARRLSSNYIFGKRWKIATVCLNGQEWNKSVFFVWITQMEKEREANAWVCACGRERGFFIEWKIIWEKMLDGERRKRGGKRVHGIQGGLGRESGEII